jgi:hypothetical protein
LARGDVGDGTVAAGDGAVAVAHHGGRHLRPERAAVAAVQAPFEQARRGLGAAEPREAVAVLGVAAGGAASRSISVGDA